MESNLRQQDLLSESYCGYSNSYIVPNKPYYSPNDAIEIRFDKQPGVLIDFSSVKLIHRTIMKAGNVDKLQPLMIAPMVPEDAFSCSSVTIDNQEIIQSNQSLDGRNVITNLFQYYLTDEQPPLPSTGQNFEAINTKGAGGLQHICPDYTKATGVYLDPNNTYSVQGTTSTATLTQSQAVYLKDRQMMSNNVNRYYNADIKATDFDRTVSYIPSADGAVQTPSPNELYTWQVIKLSDIIPELQSFNKFHLDRKVSIILKVNTPQNCLSSNVSVNCITDCKMDPTVTLQVMDLQLYARFYKINPLLMQQAVQIYSQPTPTISFVHDSDKMAGLVNIRTGLNHSKILGAVVAFTRNLRGAKEEDKDIVNYDEPKDSLKYPQYHTLYNVDYSQLYVEIGGKRYKSSDLNMNKKNVMSYIDAQIQCGQIFSGKHLNCTPQQYLQNKHYVFVDIDSQGLRTFDKGQYAHLHIEFQDEHQVANAGTLIGGGGQKVYSNYKVEVYYIVGVSLVGNRLES